MKRIFPIALAILFLAGGCGGGGGGGGGSNNSTPSGPHVNTVQIFSGGYTIDAVAPAWSPDGTTIVFQGAVGINIDTSSVGADILTVSAAAGTTPTKVTNATSPNAGGGYTPAYYTPGSLSYFVGSIGSDGNMHLMTAAVGQTENTPPPSILHTFNSSDLDGEANNTAVPAQLTLAKNGDVALLRWSTSPPGTSWKAWILDWSAGTLNATPVQIDLLQCVINPEGTYIAYLKTDLNVAYQRLPLGSGTETVIGQGWSVSWAMENRLGFAVFEGYTVYTVPPDGDTGTSVTYASSQVLPNYTTISWDATKVVFPQIVNSKSFDTLILGTLVNQ